MYLFKIYIFIILFLLLRFTALANQPLDSIPPAKPKEIKRYIKPCIYLNTYSTPKTDVRKNRFKSYSFQQSNLGAYLPLYTNTWYRKDSFTLSTYHLLATGNIATAKPTFGSMYKSPEFYKLSLGLRTIYSTGKKSIWFFDFNPFVAEDNLNYLPTWRYAVTVIYNRTVSKNFSYRLGLTKTYLFGEGLNLPIIGCRIGPLDNAHVSIQLPRSIEFNFPMGQKFWGGVFIKPVGGRYNYFNTDTTFNKGIDYTIQFGRYEINSGYLVDFRPNQNISINASMGLVTKRYIALADNNNPEGHGYEPFFKANVAPTLFLSFGASIRFGKAKQINNNYEIYDVLDMNNAFDPGDNNAGPTNSNIPNDSKRIKVNNIQYQDIKDLIEETDLN